MEHLKEKTNKLEFKPAQMNIQMTFVVQRKNLTRFLFRSILKLL
ncbi:MAG: hypothetical protein ACTSPY_13580 [Candidatus Helarchaeota archaeon]